MIKLVAVGLLLCACGSAEPAEAPNVTPVSALVERPDTGAGGRESSSVRDEPSAAADDGGEPASGGAESGAGDTGSPELEPSNAGQGGETEAGTGGDAGDAPSAGGSSSSGAGAGSSSGGLTGVAGAGGSAHAFSCPDPKPDDGIAWRVYTVRPGRCLQVGDSSWSGQLVCRETSPNDGTCSAECKNYLSVRVGLLDEPVQVAVMPLSGIVFENSPDDSYACNHAPIGVRP